MQVIPIIIGPGAGESGESGDSLEQLARLFKTLGDPNRLKLLMELMDSGSGKSVGAAAGCCEVDISVVSRHLKQLEESGVLSREKLGKEVFYRVDSQQVPDALRSMADAMTACCVPPEKSSNKE